MMKVRMAGMAEGVMVVVEVVVVVVWVMQVRMTVVAARRSTVLHVLAVLVIVLLANTPGVRRGPAAGRAAITWPASPVGSSRTNDATVTPASLSR